MSELSLRQKTVKYISKFVMFALLVLCSWLFTFIGISFEQGLLLFILFAIIDGD